jgi:signal peptidase I
VAADWARAGAAERVATRVQARGITARERQLRNDGMKWMVQRDLAGVVGKFGDCGEVEGDCGAGKGYDLKSGERWQRPGAFGCACSASNNMEAEFTVKDEQESQNEITETESQAGVETSKAVMRSWARDMVVSVLVSAFIIFFLYQPVRVEGTSMLPRLEDQDRLFINKFAYRVGEIQRGDVVVFLYPHDHSKSYIKRVIGLPGDKLRIEQGRVYVNGRPIEEPYVPERFADDRSEAQIVLPDHEYYVMGDHRSISSDSRDFGPVDRDLIYGKAAFVYWPMDQAGVVR